MNLFQLGEFKLHSGGTSLWKIDCDALSDEDIQTLAVMGKEALGCNVFGEVIGIPRGGLPLAQAMRQFSSPGAPPLIVDDVLTTGQSMRDKYNEIYTSGQRPIGLVIFARTVPPHWVFSILQVCLPASFRVPYF